MPRRNRGAGTRRGMGNDCCQQWIRLHCGTEDFGSRPGARFWGPAAVDSRAYTRFGIRAGPGVSRSPWFLVRLAGTTTTRSRLISAGNFQELLTEYPSVGGISPKVSPVWEKEPPAWLLEYGLYCLSYNEPKLVKQFSRRAVLSARTI